MFWSRKKETEEVFRKIAGEKRCEYCNKWFSPKDLNFYHRCKDCEEKRTYHMLC